MSIFYLKLNFKIFSTYFSLKKIGQKPLKMLCQFLNLKLNFKIFSSDLPSPLGRGWTTLAHGSENANGRTLTKGLLLRVENVTKIATVFGRHDGVVGGQNRLRDLG